MVKGEMDTHKNKPEERSVYVRVHVLLLPPRAIAAAFQIYKSSSHNTQLTIPHTPTGVWQATQVPELTSLTREQQLRYEKTVHTVWQHTAAVFREQK